MKKFALLVLSVLFIGFGFQSTLAQDCVTEVGSAEGNVRINTCFGEGTVQQIAPFEQGDDRHRELCDFGFPGVDCSIFEGAAASVGEAVADPGFGVSTAVPDVPEPESVTEIKPEPVPEPVSTPVPEKIESEPTLLDPLLITPGNNSEAPVLPGGDTPLTNEIPLEIEEEIDEEQEEAIELHGAAEAAGGLSALEIFGFVGAGLLVLAGVVVLMVGASTGVGIALMAVGILLGVGTVLLPSSAPEEIPPVEEIHGSAPDVDPTDEDPFADLDFEDNEGELEDLPESGPFIPPSGFEDFDNEDDGEEASEDEEMQFEEEETVPFTDTIDIDVQGDENFRSVVTVLSAPEGLRIEHEVNGNMVLTSGTSGIGGIDDTFVLQGNVSGDLVIQVLGRTGHSETVTIPVVNGKVLEDTDVDVDVRSDREFDFDADDEMLEVGEPEHLAGVPQEDVVGPMDVTSEGERVSNCTKCEEMSAQLEELRSQRDELVIRLGKLTRSHEEALSSLDDSDVSVSDIRAIAAEIRQVRNELDPVREQIDELISSLQECEESCGDYDLDDEAVDLADLAGVPQEVEEMVETTLEDADYDLDDEAVDLADLTGVPQEVEEIHGSAPTSFFNTLHPISFGLYFGALALLVMGVLSLFGSSRLQGLLMIGLGIALVGATAVFGPAVFPDNTDGELRSAAPDQSVLDFVDCDPCSELEQELDRLKAESNEVFSELNQKEEELSQKSFALRQAEQSGLPIESGIEDELDRLIVEIEFLTGQGRALSADIGRVFNQLNACYRANAECYPDAAVNRSEKPFAEDQTNIDPDSTNEDEVEDFDALPEAEMTPEEAIDLLTSDPEKNPSIISFPENTCSIGCDMLRDELERLQMMQTMLREEREDVPFIEDYIGDILKIDQRIEDVQGRIDVLIDKINEVCDDPDPGFLQYFRQEDKLVGC